MSLDNILAVVALARGNMVALAAGILLSMVLLSVASALIAKLIARFPLLLYAAALILAWTAGTMLLDDPRLHPMLAQLDAQVPGPSLVNAMAPVCVALVLLFGLLMLALRNGRKRKPA
jgi:predicted tellurium resistance membrane protein TerC